MHSSHARTLVPVATAALLLGGCWQRSVDYDPAEIAAMYPHKVFDTCSSWIRSFKTGYQYCASPPLDVPVAVNMGAAAAAPSAVAVEVDETKIDKDSLMARGEVVYGQVCVACHQANGEGVPGAFPPLAGAGDFYGPPSNHAAIIINGLQGEITVKGVTYNGVMPPQGSLSDYDVAAVATYERHSWGNDDGIVTPEDVKAVR